MAMLTSVRQTKWKIVVSVLNARAHSRLYRGSSKLETRLRGDVNFHLTNKVEVLIVISL